MRGFEACVCMTEFDCPEVTLCCRQDVKIQLLTNLWSDRTRFSFQINLVHSL